ncbi:MAG: DUF4179 domain-containing protein, partial [Anaerolineae bacterium]|nr:DUF4179 domain-containing protein [Anaerolineae bacterium]
MDDKHLREALRQITQEDIPEVNLLKNIQDELTVPRRKLPTFRALRLAGAALIMLTVSAVAYGVFQGMGGDPGLEAAQEANLVTIVNQSQTVDGVTLTLNWAYVDAYRVAIGYSIEGRPDEHIPSYRATSPTLQTAFIWAAVG